MAVGARTQPCRRLSISTVLVLACVQWAVVGSAPARATTTPASPAPGAKVYDSGGPLVLTWTADPGDVVDSVETATRSETYFPGGGFLFAGWRTDTFGQDRAAAATDLVPGFRYFWHVSAWHLTQPVGPSGEGEPSDSTFGPVASFDYVERLWRDTAEEAAGLAIDRHVRRSWMASDPFVRAGFVNRFRYSIRFAFAVGDAETSGSGYVQYPDGLEPTFSYRFKVKTVDTYKRYVLHRSARSSTKRRVWHGRLAKP
ncbi:MAG TPA: hypothetical protein VKB03_05260 [Conexibacter sp.]|nr:hypothetical protein [Conexibacter sp.]